MSTVSGNRVILDAALVKRVYDHCKQRVANYESGRSATDLSMLGIEHDVERQAKSMRAECAFCLWCGGDIEDIHWEAKVDGGWDVALPLLGHLFDVKQTVAGGHYLTWPLSKNHLYARKHFHYLVLVTVDGPICDVIGYVSKETFWRTKHVAPAGHDLIEGTWYLDARKRELLDPELLNRYRRYVPSDHPLYQDGVRP